MTPADRTRLNEALDWVCRIHDPSFADWGGHLAWLEADPRNPPAFDRASLLIEDATAGLASVAPVPRPANDDAPDHSAVRGRRHGWVAAFALAVAASITAVAVPTLLTRPAERFVVETGPGERRAITIDGTSIALNGGTRLRLDREQPRLAVLEHGEALFEVLHDAAHPFEVAAGDARFRDVGTAFDVVRREGSVELAVRDGAVLYDPDGAALRLGSGQQIRISAHSATVRPIERAAVGGWTAGRLQFREASLPDVAEDVARNIGEPIAVDPALAGRRFSGVVLIDADHARTVRRLAAVMDVAIRPAPHGWRMIAPGR